MTQTSSQTCDRCSPIPHEAPCSLMYQYVLSSSGVWSTDSVRLFNHYLQPYSWITGKSDSICNSLSPSPVPSQLTPVNLHSKSST